MKRPIPLSQTRQKQFPRTGRLQVRYLSSELLPHPYIPLTEGKALVEEWNSTAGYTIQFSHQAASHVTNESELRGSTPNHGIARTTIYRAIRPHEFNSIPVTEKHNL